MDTLKLRRTHCHQGGSKMPKISVYHIQEHPSLREPGGLKSFMKDHELVKKLIRLRRASSRSSYDMELLDTLRKVDRIGENVNKLVDNTLGKDLNALHPEVGRIRQEIAQFNLKFNNIRSLVDNA